MKVRPFVIAAALLFVPSAARAQVKPSEEDLRVTCGDIQRQNIAYQFGDYGTWLEYIVATNRSVNSCSMTVAVEARVVDAEQSAHSDSGLFSATARTQVPLPYPGIWQTDGRHFFTYWYSLVPPTGWTYELMPTASRTAIELKFRRDPELECVMLGGEWDGWTAAFRTVH